MDEIEFSEEFLEVEGDDNQWMPCPICSGPICQIRKASFECQKCFHQFIADEKDMKK